MWSKNECGWGNQTKPVQRHLCQNSNYTLAWFITIDAELGYRGCEHRLIAPRSPNSISDTHKLSGCWQLTQVWKPCNHWFNWKTVLLGVCTSCACVLVRTSLRLRPWRWGTWRRVRTFCRGRRNIKAGLHCWKAGGSQYVSTAHRPHTELSHKPHVDRQFSLMQWGLQSKARLTLSCLQLHSIQIILVQNREQTSAVCPWGRPLDHVWGFLTDKAFKTWFP